MKYNQIKTTSLPDGPREEVPVGKFTQPILVDISCPKCSTILNDWECSKCGYIFKLTSIQPLTED